MQETNRYLLTILALYQSFKARIVSRHLLVFCMLKKMAEVVLLHVFRLGSQPPYYIQLDWLALLVADPLSVNSTRDTEPHPIVLVNLNILLLKAIKESA